MFLGGDQFNTLVLGKQLRYKTLLYAESVALWPSLADGYVLRTDPPPGTGTAEGWISSVRRPHGTLISTP